MKSADNFFDNHRNAEPMVASGQRGLGRLAGMDRSVVEHDYCQWQGKSFIGGGRKPRRDALYMPALVAMRFNPDLKAKHDAL